MEQLYRGIITKKLRRPAVKNAKFIVRVTDSEDGSCVGKKVHLVAGFDPPVSFIPGVRIRFYGRQEKISGRLCVCVKNLCDVRADAGRGSIEAMRKHKIRLNGYEGTEEVVTYADDSDADATDIAGIYELISQIGYGYDKAVEVWDTLRHRARKHEYESVTEMIEDNPLIIQQVNGITYKEAYDLASRLGKATRDSYDLEMYAAATAIVWKFSQNGESFMPLRDLALRLKGVHNRYYPKEEYVRHSDLIRILEAAPKTPRGKVFGTVYFQNFGKTSELKDYRRACYAEAGRENPERDAAADMLCTYAGRVIKSEKEAAELLAKHISNGVESDDFMNSIVGRIEEWNRLDDRQKEAVLTALRHRFCIWIGAAGTGKTYTVKAMAKALLSAGIDVYLLAPTAVAADRLASGVPGAQGMTVHRYAGIQEKESDLLLIESLKEEDDFFLPFLKGGRFIVVDEAAMLDVCAFYHLMLNVNSNDHVVICGDPYQLPAVGPSGYVHQLCRMRLPQIPVVELDVPHRHGNGKGEVYEFASSIRRGELAVPENPQAVSFRGGSKREIVSLVRELYRQGVGREDVMVLVPTKSKPPRSGSDLCADTLNFLMQSEFNPGGEPIPGTPFRVGDPVINVRNDYYQAGRTRVRVKPGNGENGNSNGYPDRHEERKENVYNGYRGVIVEANDEELVVEYLTPSGPKREPYTLGEAPIWLDLAYALTVHKAQGGEADHVIVAGVGEMDRQMLYTAVTRAKKKLYLMSSPEEAEKAVARVRPEPRSGFIVKLLRAMGPFMAAPGEIVI